MKAVSIPAGFFPDPGTPLSTAEQRDLAVALHNSRMLSVQKTFDGTTWDNFRVLSPDDVPHHYRLAQPEPRTGEVRMRGVWHQKFGWNRTHARIKTLAIQWAVENGVTAAEIEFTARIKEILE